MMSSGPCGGLAKLFKSAFKAPRARTNRRYPEQSSRQAMRGHRRAQGGPGIELNPFTGKYQPVFRNMWF